MQTVPKDVVAACYYAGPQADGPADREPSALRLATFLADRAQEFGLLSQVNSNVRGWVDTLVSVAVAFDHPHAVAVLGVAAEARPDGGHELASLRAAVIIQPRGPGVDIERRIRHLLNTYTNSKDTALISRIRGAGVPKRGGDAAPEEGANRDGSGTGEGVTCALRDQRLADWAVMEWGPVGSFYVIAIGDGTFQRIAETIRNPTQSLAGEPWFADAFMEAHGEQAAFLVHARFDALRRGVDPLLTRKIERVQNALRLRGVERGLWAFGYDGRALEAHGWLRRDGRDEPLTIAGRRLLSRLNTTVIPDEATRYAVIDCNPQTLFRSVREAYLASRSPAAQDKSRAFWGDLQARSGVSFERDIFARLGHTIVIHDYPRHPLRIPLARTVLLRVEGDRETLRQHLGRFFSFCRQEFGGRSWLQLRRHTDNIWYIRFGIAGPALAVTDQWVVISFSLEAVRQNVATLSAKPTTTSDQ